MSNLNELYETDAAFADIVDEAAAAAIGTTSTEFAREWLRAEPTQKAVGDVSRENLRVEIAHLESRVEQMREQLGRAADLAGAILRVCMDCEDYSVVDMDGEVLS